MASYLPAKPNFDRRPRTAKTIYPELPPDQASISIHSCQHWPHSRCKNINTLNLPPPTPNSKSVSHTYLPSPDLSIDNYIHSHCAESIWSLHRVFSSYTGITVSPSFQDLPYTTVSNSSLHVYPARQYASHVSRILTAKLSPLPWSTSKSAASPVTKVKRAILPSQPSILALPSQRESRLHHKTFCQVPEQKPTGHTLFEHCFRKTSPIALLHDEQETRVVRNILQELYHTFSFKQQQPPRSNQQQHAVCAIPRPIAPAVKPEHIMGS